ncbi:unnamed protein product, partial [Prorocentrum cordatum]
PGAGGRARESGLPRGPRGGRPGPGRRGRGGGRGGRRSGRRRGRPRGRRGRPRRRRAEDEGGHEEGEAESEHEEMSSVDIAVLVMFFGGAILGRCGQMFLSYPDADVRVSANRMFCVAVSIFIAMTIWSLCHSFLVHQLIPSPFPRGLAILDEVMQQRAELFIMVCLFAGLWILISLFCHWTGDSKLREWRGAAKTLTPHVCGFAGANVVMRCMVLAHAWAGMMGVAVAGVTTCGVLLLCMAATEAMRQQRCYTETLSEQEQHECLEAAMEGEDEAAAFITSAVLLGTSAVAFHMGNCDVEEHVGNIEHTHCVQACMKVLMYLLAPLIIVFPCAANSKLCGSCTGRSMFQRSARNVKVIMAMTISRALLYVTRSTFEGMIDQSAVAQLSTAIVVSLSAIILTIAFDSIADRLEKKAVEEGPDTRVMDGNSDSEDLPECPGNVCSPLSGGASPSKAAVQHLMFSTRNFIGVFGLLVGLSWEAVFEAGNKTLVTWINDQIHADGMGDHKVILQTCLTLLVLGVVLPGWAKYLVPLAERTKEFHNSNIEHEKDTTPVMCDRRTLRMLVRRGACCCRRSHDHGAESDDDETSCEE